MSGLISGVKSTINNTSISSVLMTAASMYFTSKNNISWYFSSPTNFGSVTTSLKNPTEAVLPSAFFIDMNITQGGQAVGAPIEEGSFNVYNKVTEPMSITACLAFDENKGAYHTINWQGLKTSITRKTKSLSVTEVLNRLVILKKEPITFNIVTPYYEYKDFTLETYEYAWKREQGMGVLFVNARFKEIPQIKITALTTAKVSSATCATVQQVGTKVAEVETSVARSVSDQASQSGLKSKIVGGS